MKAKNYRTGETKEVGNFVYCTDMDKIVECPECGNAMYKNMQTERTYALGELDL